MRFEVRVANILHFYGKIFLLFPLEMGWDAK